MGGGSHTKSYYIVRVYEAVVMSRGSVYVIPLI